MISAFKTKSLIENDDNPGEDRDTDDDEDAEDAEDAVDAEDDEDTADKVVVVVIEEEAVVEDEVMKSVIRKAEPTDSLGIFSL